MRTWNEILSDSVLQAVDPSIEELETYLTDYQEVTERSPEWQKAPKESVELKLAVMRKQPTTINAKTTNDHRSHHESPSTNNTRESSLGARPITKPN